MPTITTQQALELAIQHQSAGQLQQADAIYRQVLALEPGNADALHLLGVLNFQAGRVDVAIDLVSRAISANPSNAQFLSNFGQILIAAGRFDQAIEVLRQAIALQPAFADAHQNLGHALIATGHPDEALSSFERLLQLRPNFPEGLLNLAVCNLAMEKAEPAVAALHKAIYQKPDFCEGYIELGNAMYKLGCFNEAVSAYRRATELRPSSAEILYNLGTALLANHQRKEAIAAFENAVAIQPEHFKTWINLSGALANDFRLTDAIAASRRALSLRPNSHEPYLNLANALCASGRVSEAIETLRTALRVAPDWSAAQSSLAYFIRYDPAATNEQIAAEHRRWNEILTHRVTRRFQSHDNDRSPQRRLRIGYVSPDFREHSLAYFMEPLLANHDARQFEIFAYANVSSPDQRTARFRELPIEWHDISAMNDEQAAELIHAHRIDILVDLAGHTLGGRLPVFAQKPAPIQIAYLGYPNSTGLDAIDYQMTDIWTAPAENSSSQSHERPIQLPHTLACYQPDPEAPPVAPPPVLANGYITFASMNILPKVNALSMECWARILTRVPNSRLKMFAPGLADRAIAERFDTAFRNLGIETGRVDFTGQLPVAQYLEAHGAVDILLDTFPMNGHTITCHALWMGVPVVTLAGTNYFGRLGASVLSNLNLQALIAESVDEYVEAAAKLAGDVPKLAELRSTLRQRMKDSRLMDGASFARDVEQAYRDIWQRWCAAGGST